MTAAASVLSRHPHVHRSNVDTSPDHQLRAAGKRGAAYEEGAELHRAHPLTPATTLQTMLAHHHALAALTAQRNFFTSAASAGHQVNIGPLGLGAVLGGTVLVT